MFEKNQPSAMRRSGDEFLRRMNSGDLPGRSLPTMNVPSPAPNDGSSGANSGANSNGAGGAGNGSNGTGCADMPSLAMVYSPVQEWRNLLGPQEALSNGSLFCELIKPCMGRSIYRGSR